MTHKCSPPPANTPQEKLDNRLHEFLHTHRNTVVRYFKSCGMFNGSPRMLMLLRQNPGMTQRELSDALHVAAPTLSVSVKRNEAEGLIERRADEKDARLSRLYLTDKGREVDDRCAKGREFFIETLFADFSDADIAVLDRLLSRMTDNLAAALETLPEDPDKKEETI